MKYFFERLFIEMYAFQFKEHNKYSLLNDNGVAHHGTFQRFVKGITQTLAITKTCKVIKKHSLTVLK